MTIALYVIGAVVAVLYVRREWRDAKKGEQK